MNPKPSHMKLGYIIIYVADVTRKRKNTKAGRDIPPPAYVDSGAKPLNQHREKILKQHPVSAGRLVRMILSKGQLFSQVLGTRMVVAFKHAYIFVASHA
jgi:hypothetical protein